jgi:regulator of telomere elongation helicase 1
MNRGGQDDTHVPKILYASRTHTQLSQTIKELKETGHTPTVCVLASREQLCINHEVSQLSSNAAKTAICKQKVAARACSHFIEFDQAPPEAKVTAVMDIEDLVAHGTETKMCPYYLSRANLDEAEIIVLPYNYLVDPDTRRSQRVSLTRNIVIIDEAHNMEKSGEDSSSFDIQPQQYAGYTSEIDQLIGRGQSAWQTDDRISVEDLMVMKAALLDIETFIHTLNIGDKPTDGKAFAGAFIYQIFAVATINWKTHHLFADNIDKAVALLLADKGSNGMCHLQGFGDILKTIFSQEAEKNPATITQTYKVFIKEAEPDNFRGNEKKKKKSAGWGDSAAGTVAAPPLKRGRVVSFWCFSPGVAVSEMESHGPHAMIMTSGTLSPIASFTSELAVPFPISLENGHVISPKQIWVGVVKQGPAGHPLNSSYNSRSDPRCVLRRVWHENQVSLVVLSHAHRHFLLPTALHNF